MIILIMLTLMNNDVITLEISNMIRTWFDESNRLRLNNFLTDWLCCHLLSYETSLGNNIFFR